MTLNGHMSNITTYTAEATTSEYRQEPNRTKSPEDNIRVHNQQATGCCLGASLLRNEVVVLELNEEATNELLSICRTCRSRATGCRQKGKKRQKRKKSESKYQRHVLARQDRLCSPVGGVNFARLYGGV